MDQEFLNKVLYYAEYTLYIVGGISIFIATLGLVKMFQYQHVEVSYLKARRFLFIGLVILIIVAGIYFFVS